MQVRYPFAALLDRVCAHADVRPKDVLQRSGIGVEPFLANAQISALDWFRNWTALKQLSPNPHFERDLGMALSTSHLCPQTFVFSCCDTLRHALQRQQAYSALIWPIKGTFAVSDDTLTLTVTAATKATIIPPSLELTNITYLLALMRRFSNRYIVPERIEMAHGWNEDSELAEFFGCRPVTTGATRMVFRADAVDVPVRAQVPSPSGRVLPQTLADAQIKHRLETVLHRALPAGDTTLSAIASRLGLPLRSLQRRLADEGASFQSVLAKTRLDLAMGYLTRSPLSTPEIAFLLGFSNPSSFYRAFRDWTGTTPGEMRTNQLAAVH